MGHDADDFDEIGFRDAAVDCLPVPAVRQPARVGDDQVDHVHPGHGQVGAGIVGIRDGKGGKGILDLCAGRAVPGMTGLRHHFHPLFAGQPAAGFGQPVPRPLMRCGNIVAYRIG